MSRMYEGWCPRVGDWVIYRPHNAAQPEDGEVTEIRGANAMVRYRGDLTAKSTPIWLLSPGTAR